MARENQGLQIGLIVFVILTIGLAVTTFMFFKQADEASMKAKAAEESEAKKGKELKMVSDENDAMKEELIGIAKTEPISAVRKAFNEDMLAYASAYEKPTQKYRKVVEKLFSDLQKKNEALAAEQATVKDLTDKLARLEAEKQPQIEKSMAEAKKLSEDLVNRTKSFDDDRKKLNDEKDELAGKLEKSRKDADKALANIQAKLDDAMKNVVKFRNLYGERTSQLEQVTKQEFEVAEGLIRWVNQHNGTVWINLGQSDNLQRHVSFSVYNADTNDVTKAAKKASIEVTQILGEHLAEARIVEDVISDPIMPGDVIYTPLWRPGEQQHIALAGDMDIDGDGKSDLKLLLNIISMNNAVADMYVDDNGKRVGKLATTTRFLALGNEPEIKKGDKGDDAVKVYSQVQKDAKELGIRTITLNDLLKRMGFKNETHVVRFGAGMNLDDFKPRLPDGRQKVSSGNLSPLYQPPQKGETRRSTTKAGSAY